MEWSVARECRGTEVFAFVVTYLGELLPHVGPPEFFVGTRQPHEDRRIVFAMLLCDKVGRRTRTLAVKHARLATEQVQERLAGVRVSRSSP